MYFYELDIVVFQTVRYTHPSTYAPNFFFIIDNFVMADTCSVVNLSHQIYILCSINVTESWGKWAGRVPRSALCFGG